MQKQLTIILIFLIIFFTGCAKKYDDYIYHRSSVVDYLYSNEQGVALSPFVALLKFPLKVGIGFAPSKVQYHQRIIDETERVKLMRRVQGILKKYNMGDTKIIPSAFFEQNGGFEHLKEIKKLYDIDLIVLVSYDYLKFTDNTPNHITYWGIIGGDIVESRENLIHTMVNASLFDIESKKLAFISSGVSRIRGKIDAKQQKKGFLVASEMLLKDLNLRLSLLSKRKKKK